MNPSRTTVVVALCLFGVGWFGGVHAKEPIEFHNPELFGEGFELGLFGAGALPDGGGGEMGGGVSLAYYFTPQIGIDASYAVFAFESEVHTVSADIVLRYPVSQAGIAPYFLVGGGLQTDGDTDGLYRLGAGLDVRFQDFGLGIFADGIYNWVVGQENFTIARLGVRIPF